MQCDDCNKWRLLPPGSQKVEDEDVWMCMDNADVHHNKCEDPEQQEHQVMMMMLMKLLVLLLLGLLLLVLTLPCAPVRRREAGEAEQPAAGLARRRGGPKACQGIYLRIPAMHSSSRPLLFMPEARQDRGA